MTALKPPRHPYVVSALRLAERWCMGREVDGAPVLQHAIAVTRKLTDLVPDVDPALTAAALLHDAQRFAPHRAQLDVVLKFGVAPRVAAIAAALAAEQKSMNRGFLPPFDDPDVTLVSAVNKVVAFRALLRRAGVAGDPPGFWMQRASFRRLLPYHHRWLELAGPTLPPAVVDELRVVLADLSSAIRAALSRV